MAATLCPERVNGLRFTQTFNFKMTGETFKIQPRYFTHRPCVALMGWICPPPDNEPVLRSLLGGLFAEGLVPPGVIIDAGANDGSDACYYAERQPQRTVHAVEPTLMNVEFINRRWSSRLPNLKALHGGLGSLDRIIYEKLASNSTSRSAGRYGAHGGAYQVSGVAQLPTVDGSKAGAPSFRIHRIDDLFSSLWRGERLGLAHFDVEGAELDVLMGAKDTIRRDRPVFTVETFVHNHPNLTWSLMRTISLFGYQSYMVEEQCGLPVDCRNIINIPRELLPSFVKSPTLDLATTVGVFFPISEDSIARHAYAPVCKAGAPCCAAGPVNSFGLNWWRSSCCNRECVDQWLDKQHGGKRMHRHWSNEKPKLYGSR